MSDPDKLELKRLGPYEILAELGQGGMGIVYRARQVGLDRMVALKVVRPQLAMNPALLARFKREYTVHAGIAHPNIVKFYDAGEADGLTFYAMEYLDARPLDKILRQRDTTQDFRLIVGVAEALASSLAYLHEKGILHRDIKPSNIMIENETGRVVLMDFGLVKPAHLTALTKVGKTVGSPRYMSPEMMEGKQVDARSDIYQAGVTLYELLTGLLPYDGEDLVTLARAIMTGGCRSPKEVNPAISLSFSNMVMNCLAREPDARYPDAKTFKEDASRIRASRTVRLLTEPKRTLDGSGGVSASQPLKVISSSTLEVSRPVELGRPRPGLLAGLAALAVLSLVPLLWPRGARYRAEEIEVAAGVRAARVRWRGKPEYPSRVAVRRAGEPDWTGAQVHTGPDPLEDGRHETIVEPLEPGQDYEVRIEFPDGTASLAQDVPAPAAEGPRIESRRVLPVGTELALEYEVRPSCLATLRFRGPDGWHESTMAAELSPRLAARIPAPPPDGAWTDVDLTLSAIGARKVVRLDDFLGTTRRHRSFVAKAEALDMAEVIQTLRGEEKRPEALAPLARSLVADTGALALAEELAAGPPLDPADPTSWQLYRAFRKLEAIDAWLHNQKRPPALGLEAAYRSLVRVAWPETLPGGSVLVADFPDEDSSFSIQGGTVRGRMILDVYQASSALKARADYEGTFELPAGPRGARAALALRSRNLTPEHLVRFAVNDGPELDVWNSGSAFKGLFWKSIQDDGKTIGMDVLLKYANYAAIEFPSRFLHAGSNRIRIQVRIAEGLQPTQFIDIYDVRVWADAPAGLMPPPAPPGAR